MRLNNSKSGVPLDYDGVMSYGVKNFNGRLCLNFSSVLSSVAQFERAGRLRTLLFDERYTSKEARARIKTGRMKGTYIHTCPLYVSVVFS